MTTPAVVRSPDPEPVHLYYSKARAVFVLVLNLAVILWLGYVALAGLLSGYFHLLLAGGASLLFISPVLAMFVLESFRAATQNDVVVTLDATGVTDRRKKDPFLGWEEIGQATLGNMSQVRSYLIFEFRSAGVAKARRQGSSKFLLRKVLFLGDWHVNLRPLRCKPGDVLRVAKRMHRHAIRQRAIARNGPPSGGWSGTL